MLRRRDHARLLRLTSALAQLRDHREAAIAPLTREAAKLGTNLSANATNAVVARWERRLRVELIGPRSTRAWRTPVSSMGVRGTVLFDMLERAREYTRLNRLARAIAGLAGEARTVAVRALARSLQEQGVPADTQDAAHVLDGWLREVEISLSESPLEEDIEDTMVRMRASKGLRAGSPKTPERDPSR